MNAKSILFNLCPPAIPKIARHFGIGTQKDWFSGNYTSWKEASSKCSGYYSEIILEKVLMSSLKVRDGLAIAERDSVIFGEIPYSFPLLTGLLLVASKNNNQLRVLDFGGALGSSYFHYNKILTAISTLEWSIIEQPNFVKAGKQYFETDELKFYPSIDICLAERKPNVAIFSSVIQYLDTPHAFLDKVAAFNFSYLIFDRTAFLDRGHNDRLTIQTVPEEIYPARYPAWFFSSDSFFAHFKKYSLLIKFNLPECKWNLNGQLAHYGGAILALNT